MSGFSVKKGVLVDYSVGKTFQKKDGSESAFVNLSIELSTGGKFPRTTIKKISIEEDVFNELFQVSRDALIKSECLYVAFDGLEYKLPPKADDVSEELYQNAVKFGLIKKTLGYRENKHLALFEITKLSDGEAVNDGDLRYVNPDYEAVENLMKVIKKAL